MYGMKKWIPQRRAGRKFINKIAFALWKIDTCHFSICSSDDLSIAAFSFGNEIKRS